MNRLTHHEETLFEQALSLRTPAERESFLMESCANDLALRDRLTGLLGAHFRSGRFLEHQEPDPSSKESGLPDQSESPAAAATDPLTEGLGTVIGRYKLLQKIGEGGCGVVYMAEQSEPVKRRVAIKVIRLGMDTKSVIARFEAERQALALMDHPNIAKVLDAGATDAGRPYFVMELVRGTKITEYCDQHNLAARDRLDLFTKVCQAVQHAHQKGIIHRDIKPSNILVTLHDGVPAPKVIDFGIAKATTDQRLTDRTLFTALEQFIGTPAYMSPEQAEMSGLDIDTRCDIYGLGVLLYELLTGRTPFDAKELMGSGIDAMRKMIREKEPLRPSTKLNQLFLEFRANTLKSRSSDTPGSEPELRDSPRRLLQIKETITFLRGDLDWIVMKCLEKDRARRYETANGLASDIQRYLHNEVVLARPPSAAYRVRKMVRRNKLTFAAASAVALALIAGLGFSTWSFLRERKAHTGEAEQRSKAEAEKVTAERHLYVAKMNQAQQAWEQNNLDRLRQLLEETKASPNRGFEWSYWQRQTHLPLRTLRGHLGDVTSVAFSPDGQRIVTGSWDQNAIVWEAASGRELLRLSGHSAPIWCVAFSRDGQRIVTGSWDQTAKVWDAANGTNLVTLKGHKAPIRSVAFSRDGQRIVTGSWDQNAIVWEAASGRLLLPLEGTDGNVGSVAFSPDGQRIVTGLGNSTAKVWDAIGGQGLFTLKGHAHQVRSVAFSPDGQHILTGSDDQTAKVWDAANGKEQLTLKGHGAEIYSVAFSPDGQRIVTGGADNTAKVWDAIIGAELLTLKGHSAAIWSVAFSPDGQRIVTGSWDQTAKVWELAIGEGLLPLLGHTNRITSMTFSPDGRWIVTASEDQTAKVWEATTGRPLLTLKGHTAGISSVAFSPDGKRIVTGSDDQTAAVWEAASGGRLLLLKGHTDKISCVAFAPDGQQIVTGSWDQTAKVWDTASGRVLRTIDGHGGKISSVAFSPDGRRIITSMGDQAKLWEVASGREVLLLKGHSGRIMSMAFSPDGQRIVTGSWDQTGKVWETASGRELLSLKGHNRGISSVAFSPDGQRIITGSDDNTAKIWEAVSGRELLPLHGHNGGIWSVAFSPDGQRIMTGSRDEMAKVWEAASVGQVAAWQKEDTTERRPAPQGRERVETAQGEPLHGSQDPGAIGHVTFTKWGTSLPANPPSLAGISLAGVVGGDVGSGRLAGEILSDGLFVTRFWLGHVRYEFYGDQHSFIADIYATENNITEPATAVITGVITQGWRKGAQLTGEYRAMPECSIATPGNVFDSVCYQCTLQIDGGSEQETYQAGPPTDRPGAY